MLRVYAALRPLLLPAARPRLAAQRAVTGGASGGAAGAPPPADEGVEKEDNDRPGEEEALSASARAGYRAPGAPKDWKRPRNADDEEDGTPEGYNFVAKLFDSPPGLDLTKYWQNALLSDESKEAMYELHASDPKTYTVDKLAADYGLRYQRVLAILTLKKSEKELEAKGWPLMTKLSDMMEKRSEALPVERGSGEEFVETMPLRPNFEVVPDDVPEEMRPVEVSEAARKASSDKLDRVMIGEFVARLRRNTGDVGGTLLRGKSRVRHSVPRPAAGWSLLVKPLGFGQNTEWVARGAPPEATPFVALPSGERRELTADEKDMVASQRVKPRRKFS